MTARQLLTSGSSWTDSRARAAIPIILRLALDGEKITYGDLNKELVKQGLSSAIAVAYRYPAGKIGDICEALSADIGEQVPLLNALIVNGESKLPSHGVDRYLEKFLGMRSNALLGMSLEERNSYAKQAIQAVHDYDSWDKVCSVLGVELPKQTRSAVVGDTIPLPDPSGFTHGPESEAHKALKAWVANNPRKFGRVEKGELEKQLASGDRLDAFFGESPIPLAVEVKAKNASDTEIQRGIFQCVKYRATLRAMQLAEVRAPNAQSILVIDGEPSVIVKKLAKRLLVTVKNVQCLR